MSAKLSTSVFALWFSGLFAAGLAWCQVDPGLPLPPPPSVRISVPDIGGKWVANGVEIQITQQGQDIQLRSGESGRNYSGRFVGNHLALTHTYASPDDVPANVPPEMRPLLVGTEARFEGDLQPDGKTIQAATVGYTIDPSDVTNRTEVRTSITLTRPVPTPTIVSVVPSHDQLAYQNGSPVYKHPSSSPDGHASRVLLVLGKDLPRKWGDAKIASTDQSVSYTIMKLAQDPSDSYQDQLTNALHRVLVGLDPSTQDAVTAMDSMLVKADLTRTVLPGTKTLTLNGAAGSWQLQFGDTTGELHFIRARDEATFEDCDDVFLPETIRIELRTSVALSLSQVDLLVRQNGQPAVVGGQSSVTATLVSPAVPSSPAGPGGSPPPVYRYRTDPIQIADLQSAQTAQNGLIWSAKPKDKLDAEMKDHELLQSEQVSTSALAADPTTAAAFPSVEVTVRRTPAELGKLWKEALTTAANCAGKPVDDFSTLSAEQATEITNYILFTTDDLASRFLSGNPFYARSLTVQIRDHAAMLLLRDEFVRMMQSQADQLPTLQGDAVVRGFKRMVAPYADNPAFPLSHIRVSPPPSGGCAPGSFDTMITSPLLTLRGQHDCPFSYAFSDSFLQQAFGTDQAAAERWSLAAVQQGLDRYRAAVNQTLNKAQGLDSCDVIGLLKLTGYSFDPVVNRLLPKLMRLDDSDGTAQWVPDMPARGAVSGLSTLAEAVRAQQDYSDLDTQAIIMAASAVVMLPALVSGAPLAALLTAMGNVAVAAVDAGVQIHQYVDHQAELQRAKGASLVLGTDRLTQAELSATPLWQTVMALANVGLASVDVLGAISQASKAGSIARGAELVSQIENGGVDALRAMSAADQRDVLAFIADAEMTRAAKGEAALSEVQQQGLAAGKALDADPRVSVELARLNGLNDPAWVGNITDPAKKQAIQEAHEVGDGELGADGVRPAAIDNYTFPQLRQKYEILRNAGFTPEETRWLMEQGVAGTSAQQTLAEGERTVERYLAARDAAAQAPSPNAAQGDIGEVSYDLKMRQQGVANMNLNDVDPANPTTNYPMFDHSNPKDGFVSSKVYTDPAGYLDDLQHMMPRNDDWANKQLAAATQISEDKAGIGSAWPAGLSPSASPEEIRNFFNQNGKIAIPDDQVPQVLAQLEKDIYLFPENWGLPSSAEPQAILDRYKQLKSRFVPMGLNTDQVNEIMASKPWLKH
jgi:hypothetical protein